jgi:transposase
MSHKYDKYSSQFKHKVLEEYRPGIIGHGFKSLAKRFKVKGGHKLIMSWYQQWDGTIDSFNPKPKGRPSRRMTQQEVEQYILEFVESMNRKRVQVNYKMVQEHVESELKRKVSIRTIRRYGKSCGIRCKKTREITSRDGSHIF